MRLVHRQGIKSSVYTYIGLGIGFVISIILLPRIITKEQYGLVQILLTLPLLFSEYIGLGFSTVLTRTFILFKEPQKQHNGFLFLALIWMLTGLVVFMTSFFLFRSWIIGENNSALLQPYIYWAIPLTIATHIYSTLERYLRYIQLNASFSIFAKEIFTRVGTLVTAGLYYFDILTFDLFIIFFCISQMSPALLVSLKLIQLKQFSLKPKLDFITKELWIKILRISVFALGAGLVTGLSSSFTNIILSKLIDLSAVTIYSVGLIIANLISVPMRVAHVVSEPILRKSFLAGNMNKIFEIYSKSCTILTIVGLFFFLCIVVNVDNVVHLLPPGYKEAKFIILLISLGTLFDMMTGVNDVLIGTSPIYYYGAIFPLVMAGLTISTNLLLIPGYGLEGAAVATMISYFLYNILRFLFNLYHFKFQPYTSKYWRIPLTALILGGIVFLIPSNPDYLIDLIIRLGILSIAWTFLVLKFNFSDDITGWAKQLKYEVIKFMNW